jgi:Rad52/22 family double-strand break repair protein
MRDKRAQGIAAMGLVQREGDKFSVSAPTLRGRKASFEVWRDEAGKVRCNCPEFEEQSANDTTYRCEHILAVKHALLLKNTEGSEKTQAVAAKTAAPEMPETNENASEKRQVRRTARLVQEPERFEREQLETGWSSTMTTEEQPLAKHETEEEHIEMIKKQEKAAVAPAPELEFQPENEAVEESVAQVVPLAFTNTLRALKQRIDPAQIRTREGWTDRQGNMHIVEYVEWHTVADILDRVTPAWSHSVKAIQQIGDTVAVIASITIDGVTREGIGTGSSESEMGIKKAEHDALKRAAVKFGIARELYQRESEVIERQGSSPDGAQFPRDPLARSMADLVTPKQLGMIRALAREAGVDADEECTSILGCKTEELSKRAASSFIDHLKNSNGAAAAGMRRAS